MTFLNELEQRIGQQHVLTGQSMQQYLEDWRGRYTGTAVVVARPASTEEVGLVVRLCAEHRVPIVRQGDNKGLCGGATPDNSATALVLSLERLNKIRSVDIDNDTMVVEAGCILQNVQQAARDHQRLFPLSLAAEGSCTIGGNLATNAGGTQVLRYGNARDLTLGLEVVTAQGEILHGLHGLRKDNTGYDLRNLFIGSEGTLGIITAATIKLYPQPVASCTALLALNTIEDAVQVLALARQGLAASLTGFELIAGNCLQAVLHCYPDQRMPFQGPAEKAAWYALLELSDSESLEHARERFETVIGQALEQELVQDAVIAETIAQSKALGHLRESIPLAEKACGKSIKHDVSISVSVMSQFVHETDKALQEAFPGLENVTFGHLGDGNLHYNVARGTAFTEEELLKRQDEIYTLVHDSVHRFHGSISAEHGVGQLKRQLLPRYKDPVALSLMKQIKTALDPLGIMNPGKVLPD